MKNPADVPGLISLETGKLLQCLAQDVPAGQCIVEIGAYLGRSTCFLASGARDDVNIISIDPHGLAGSERGRGGRFAGNHVRAKYLENVRGYANLLTMRLLSKDAPLPHSPIGLLWIDGAHDLVSVNSDVRRFAPLVASGGYIVIDDFKTWHPGVDTVVKAMMSQPQWTSWKFAPKPLAWAQRKA